MGHSRQRSVAARSAFRLPGGCTTDSRRSTRNAADATGRRCTGAVPPSSIILPLRSCELAVSGWISAASGRFFQYLRGISFCIIFSLRRAGLKMLR